MQKAYIEALYQLARENKKIISVTADNGTDYDLLFRRDMPDQFLNMGIAEQNMIAAASGMADSGYIPYISTVGAFMIYRGYEFIRDDLCIGKRNVKIFATGGGMSIGNLGPTHHTTEDVALLRTLPNLTILTPSTSSQVREAVAKAYEIDGPVYIRAEMSGANDLTPVVEGETVLRTMKEGKQVVIITTGSILEESLEAANVLSESGNDVGVFAIDNLSDFSWEHISQFLESAQLLVTVEEHCKSGGVGGMIAEMLSEKRNHPPLLRIGLDGFAVGYGTQKMVRNLNELSAETIAQKITERMSEI